MPPIKRSMLNGSVIFRWRHSLIVQCTSTMAILCTNISVYLSSISLQCDPALENGECARLRPEREPEPCPESAKAMRAMNITDNMDNLMILMCYRSTRRNYSLLRRPIMLSLRPLNGPYLVQMHNAFVLIDWMPLRVQGSTLMAD